MKVGTFDVLPSLKAPKILIFSALLDRKPGTSFEKKRLIPLCFNTFTFNQLPLFMTFEIAIMWLKLTVPRDFLMSNLGRFQMFA